MLWFQKALTWGDEWVIIWIRFMVDTFKNFGTSLWARSRMHSGCVNCCWATCNYQQRQNFSEHSVRLGEFNTEKRTFVDFMKANNDWSWQLLRTQIASLHILLGTHLLVSTGDCTLVPLSPPALMNHDWEKGNNGNAACLNHWNYLAVSIKRGDY